MLLLGFSSVRYLIDLKWEQEYYGNTLTAQLRLKMSCVGPLSSYHLHDPPLLSCSLTAT